VHASESTVLYNMVLMI